MRPKIFFGSRNKYSVARRIKNEACRFFGCKNRSKGQCIEILAHFDTGKRYCLSRRRVVTRVIDSCDGSPKNLKPGF